MEYVRLNLIQSLRNNKLARDPLFKELEKRNANNGNEIGMEFMLCK